MVGKFLQFFFVQFRCALILEGPHEVVALQLQRTKFGLVHVFIGPTDSLGILRSCIYGLPSWMVSVHILQITNKNIV